MEQSDKFRTIEDRLRNIEILVGRIEERAAATHTIACDAHDVANKANQNSLIALAAGLAGAGSSAVKLAGLI
jgi:hypothetical protein